MAWAKSIIDQAFVPRLKGMVSTLNDSLAEKGIRAGIDINWYFDKEENDEE